MQEAEWLTRKTRIDTRLRSLTPAWQIIPWREELDCSKLTCHAVTELPTANGPADYALFVEGEVYSQRPQKRVFADDPFEPRVLPSEYGRESV